MRGGEGGCVTVDHGCAANLVNTRSQYHSFAVVVQAVAV